MSEDEDYGFTYSDEEEMVEEGEADLQNTYYTAKGAPHLMHHSVSLRVAFGAAAPIFIVNISFYCVLRLQLRWRITWGRASKVWRSSARASNGSRSCMLRPGLRQVLEVEGDEKTEWFVALVLAAPRARPA